MHRRSWSHWLLLPVLLAIVPVSFGQTVSDKTLFLFLHITNQAVHVDNAMLKPVPFHATEHDGTHRYTLLSQNNQTLYTGYFPDPLVRFEDDFSDPQNPKGGRKRISDSEKLLKIPYIPAAKRIRFERQGEPTDQWVSLGVSPLPDVKN